jgi:hypothetical protein
MTSPQEYERQIYEERLKEAEEKGFLGQDGKIAIVLRNLGQPIMQDSVGGTHVDRYYLDDPYNLADEVFESRTNEELRDRIPMQRVENPDGTDPTPGGEDSEDEDWKENPEVVTYDPTAIGYHFDGLSRGMHLEIKYMEETAVFQVHYKGYEVYKEIKGHLICYVPVPEWEQWIDRLFKVAKPMEIQKRVEFAQEEAQEIEEEKTSWLEDLRKRWGL